MHNQIRSLVLLSSLGLASAASVLIPQAVDVDSCPGYNAKNVKESSHGFVADLTLAGKACNVYGSDLKDLKLEVTYDSGGFPLCNLWRWATGGGDYMYGVDISRWMLRCRDRCRDEHLGMSMDTSDTLEWRWMSRWTMKTANTSQKHDSTSRSRIPRASVIRSPSRSSPVPPTRPQAPKKSQTSCSTTKSRPSASPSAGAPPARSSSTPPGMPSSSRTSSCASRRTCPRTQTSTASASTPSRFV